MRKAIIIMFVFYFFVSPGFSSAQTDRERIAELQQQIDALEAQANQYRDNIAGQQAKARSLNGEINILKNQISQIQTNIYLTGKKIDKTQIEIFDKESNIQSTQSKIDYQKLSIAQLILSIQRRDSESLLSTMLKNHNLSDFFRQTEYTATINNSLIGLIDDFKDTKDDLESQKSDLEGTKNQLENLNKQNQYQNMSLQEVKSSKDSLLKETKGQEAQYQKMLVDVEQRKALFFNELQGLEEQVIKGGLYLIHITATSVPAKGTKLFQWPEDNHRITQGYGCTSYARCGRKSGPYGGSPHNGIDMSSGFGTQIKAIGDGEIVANGNNAGWGNWVAIKHDSGLVSLYAHMSSLSFLVVGTKIKTGDVIGFEGATGNASGSHLHLSIYKDFFTFINTKNGQLYFNYFEGTVNPLDYL